MTQSSKLDVLLIDDDPISNFITSELIQEADLPVSLHTIADSREGLDYILSKYGKATEPVTNLLVLLDLSMPGLDGFEVIDSLKANGIHEYIKIAVLTSSDHKKDRDRAQELNVASYLHKPLDTAQLQPLLKECMRYIES
jgi:CheY-like chemotaxis protein